MAIKLGTLNIKNCYLGSTKLKSINLGSTVLWKDEEEDPYQYYDMVIEAPSTGEFDIVYTSDIHVGWKNFGSSRWGEDYKVFSLDVDQLTGTSVVGGDVKTYQNKLINAGIPTILLDCGDWSKSAGETDADRAHAIDVMKNMNYFGISSGNWEFKWDPISTAFSYLNKLKGYGMMSCNINSADSVPLYPGGTDPSIPGCKTIKVGNKKIGLISISYPSPNGFSTYGEYEGSGDGVEWNGSPTITRWNYKEDDTTIYRYNDSDDDASSQSAGTAYTTGSTLYRRVQEYVSYLKNNYNFDYVIAFGHMDKYTEEDYWGETGAPYGSDSRFYTRADFLIKNIVGLDAFIPGHLNQSVAATSTYTNRDGSGTGKVAPTCGGTMNSFGRLKIDLTKSGSAAISCKLLQSVSDLETI